MKHRLATFFCIVFLPLITVWILLVSFHISKAQVVNIIYVNQDVLDGSNNGMSWADAYTDLQTALSTVSSGQEIWVASGVYKATTDPNNRTASFQLKDDVTIYGGFAATETMRIQRDWVANITVLSGDIDSNDITTSNGIVTTTANLVGANSYHVVLGNGVTNTAVLDGFIITAGQTPETGFPFSSLCGGGMYNNQSSPTLKNLIFSGNSASASDGLGGGMYNQANSSPLLFNVSFKNNSASAGGGMANRIDSSPDLLNVVFHENYAGGGGGIYNYSNSDPTLNHVVFSSNYGDFHGGGGMLNASSSPILTNTIFSGNYGSLGGGMSNSDSSPTLVNVIFSGNNSYRGGGMINSNSSPILTNVTFSGNRDNSGSGGIINSINSNPTIQNSIFWKNKSTSGIDSIINDNSSTPIIRYSLLQGCNPDGVWSAKCGINDGGNQLDADPLFLDALDPATAPTLTGNLRLQSGSPAIDVGDNEAIPNDVLTDLDGNARILNGIVDLGGYEFELYQAFLPLVMVGSTTENRGG